MKLPYAWKTFSEYNLKAACTWSKWGVITVAIWSMYGSLSFLASCHKEENQQDHSLNYAS